jgi:hypothetical protein
MLVTNHVLSGAVIGAATRRVVPAFALGVLSHFALDAVPHWGRWNGSPTFMQVAVSDGLTGLAVMGAMTALAAPQERAAVLAGMAGAALPDLDKPSKVFFGCSPFPRWVDRIHQGIQDEAAHRLKYEAAAGAAMAVAAVALTRGRLRRWLGRLLSAGPDSAADCLDLLVQAGGDLAGERAVGGRDRGVLPGEAGQVLAAVRGALLPGV